MPAVTLRSNCPSTHDRWDMPTSIWGCPGSPCHHVKHTVLFIEWNAELASLSSFKIKRCILHEESLNWQHELHVFVDASQSAMCAVVYLRSSTAESVVVSFLVGKCRVAPLRASTIPKLELQAAVIGLRLAISIQSFLPFSVSSCSFWSDSPTAHQLVCSSN